MKRGMMVLDIRGNAKKGSRLGSAPTGFGVEEEITNIRPAYPSQGREYVELHLIDVKNGAERIKYLSKTKLVEAKYKAYEGPFRYVEHSGSHPTRFTLRRDSAIEATVILDLEALDSEEEYFEGKTKHRFVNYYERDKKLRAAAVEHHGVTCKACGFNFEEAYGERGKDYIEVHHLIPVSSLGKVTRVDPRSDMTVLCSNCHRMVHRKKGHVLTPEELRATLRK